MNERDLDRLFLPEPKRWGLRGDPFVWLALREGLRADHDPRSAAELEELLHKEFERCTGVDLRDEDPPDSIYRPEYAHGGMSSGHVDIRTWRSRLMPLLVRRGRRLFDSG